MDLKQLEIFVAVVECQSFSEAAKKIFLSQPTVSSNVKQLEQEFNVLLLQRTTRQLSLTSEGQRFFKHAKQILDATYDLYDEFGSAKTASHRILIGGSTIPSAYILPQLLSEFQKAYAPLQFEIKQTDSDGVIDALIDRKVDIGFTGIHTDIEQLTCVPFAKDRLVIITPHTPYYEKLLSGPHAFKRLLEEPIINREVGSGTTKQSELFLKANGVEVDRLNIVSIMNDQEAIKRGVSSGLGISFISYRAAQDYKDLKKIFVYEPSHPIERNLYLVYDGNRRFTKEKKYFLDYVLQLCKTLDET